MLSILSNPTVSTLLGAIVGALSSIATTLLANKYELKGRSEERYSIRLEKLRQNQINELEELEKHVVSWGAADGQVLLVRYQEAKAGTRGQRVRPQR